MCYWTVEGKRSNNINKGYTGNNLSTEINLHITIYINLEWIL